jgi:hypothetical protein
MVRCSERNSVNYLGVKIINWCDAIVILMTRIRAPHDLHKTKKHDTESICAKCGKMTPKLCDWCGACLQCHTGNALERTY